MKTFKIFPSISNHSSLVHFRELRIFFLFCAMVLSTSPYAQDWNEIIKKFAPDHAFNDQFGFSVAISGDYAIVGAAFEDTAPNTDNGAAYILKKNQGGTDNWGVVKKLLASDRANSDQFGFSVAISGDYAIVGANGEDTSPNFDNGAAYIFKKDQGGSDNWGEIKKLLTSDRVDSDLFGNSVAITGDYAIVGAIGEDSSPNTFNGAAYIFRQDLGGTDNWGELKKLLASDKGNSDLFGISVSISGDYTIVGAYQESTSPNSGNGAAYIFKKDQGGADNWGEIKKLLASDKEDGDFFGISVAISGDYAIVGARNEGTTPNDRNGAAYIFKKDLGGADNWGEVKKLLASDRANSDFLGVSVSISEDYAIVGAHFEDTSPNSTNGASYIYNKDQGGADNWGEVKKLLASDRADLDRFGQSVSISGDYTIVGAYLKDFPNINSGVAYIFKNEICTPPVISCNSDITVSTQANVCNQIANYMITYSGDPTPDISYAFTGATVSSGIETGSGSIFNEGVTTVTISAVNDCGDDDCTFTITVTDDEDPVVSCPDNIEYTLSGSECDKAFEYAATAEDNCEIASISNFPTAGSTFEVGTTIVTVEATDVNGNTNTCTFTITILGDDDCDGVANACDLCPGGDDSIDNNNDGQPDCHVYPGYTNLPFSWKCSNNKVNICHNVNNSPNTICVAQNAVQAHLDHGDYLGPCGNANCGGEELKRNVTNDFLKAEQLEHQPHDYVISSSDNIFIYPNPAHDLLNIVFATHTHNPIQIQLYNSMGQEVLIKKFRMNENDESAIQLDIQSLTDGLYFIKTTSDGIQMVKSFTILK